MRDRALIVTAFVGFAASGCDIGASRPLTVEPTPDAGRPPMPEPRDAAPAVVDAAPPPVTTTPDPACWTGQLPPQAQPILPQAAVADACAAGAAATTWTFPSSGNMTSDDARAFIVGRWAACSATVGFPAGPHAGLEFGANGRWRLLALDAVGALAPMTGDDTSGYYYQLGTGQLNVTGEKPSGTYSMRVVFAAGMDALRFDLSVASSNAVYARAAPSPQNGNDNLPTVSDGRCSMVGTWDLPANPNPPGAPAATFSFDGAGNFVGGPLGSDLCAGHTMYGTYKASPGWFQLTSNVGLGACQWWFTAGYPAAFADDCSSVTLTQMWDNCTGGRGYFNRVTTMTRRP
jgi:hypothetical protein